MRFSYTGREFDDEIGLYYYRARYYDGSVGRFISEDAIGFSGGDGNLYRYVGNSSVNFTDPMGEMPVETPVKPISPVETKPIRPIRAKPKIPGLGVGVGVGLDILYDLVFPKPLNTGEDDFLNNLQNQEPLINAEYKNKGQIESLGVEDPNNCGCKYAYFLQSDPASLPSQYAYHVSKSPYEFGVLAQGQIHLL